MSYLINSLARQTGLSAGQVEHLLRDPLDELSITRVLQRGNSKLGEILSWGLPAIVTCPGSTEVCRHVCYAAGGRYHGTAVQRVRNRNLILSHRNDFVELLIGDLAIRRPTAVRVHDSGDFYSAAYARQWLEICNAADQHRFYWYTRSWLLPEIKTELDAAAALRNVRCWYSLDSATGRPRYVPRRVRLAYMQTAPEDLPDHGQVDLVFRTHNARTEPRKRVAGASVCPVEQNPAGAVAPASGANPGPGKVTCKSCAICWRSLPSAAPAPGRVPLAIV